MTKIEALPSIQFVTDSSGRRTGVLLDIQSWEALLAYLEDATDTTLAVKALKELQATGGRPEKACWLKWDEVREEWDAEKAVTGEAT